MVTNQMVVEGFSVTHAAILTGSTAAENIASQLADVYGVRSGALDVDTGDFDNTGDDGILSNWAWFNFATVTIEAGYIPFELIATLTGATITSSGTGVNAYQSLPLWNEGALNQPTRPVLVRVPAKDMDGNTRTIDFVLFKVQFAPIKFDGPTYKDGLKVNFSGKALMSTKDEAGNTLTEKAIGRVIGRPKTLGW